MKELDRSSCLLWNYHENATYKITNKPANYKDSVFNDELCSNIETMRYENYCKRK